MVIFYGDFVYGVLLMAIFFMVIFYGDILWWLFIVCVFFFMVIFYGDLFWCYAVIWWNKMWVKQCHKPPIWKWFIQPIIYKNGDLRDGLLLV